MSTTRCQFIQTVPPSGADLDVAGRFVLDQGAVRAQGTTPLKELTITADAGHVTWDMEGLRFLDKQEEFDNLHPSLVRRSKLNDNYGLHEVIHGIHQLRGLDYSDNSFVFPS